MQTEYSHRDTAPETIPDLIKELRDESTLLIRQEIALARQEFSEKAAEIGKDSTELATGGVVAHVGFLLLMIAATVGMYELLVVWEVSRPVSGWLAPLIVGAVLAIIGWVMTKAAINNLKDVSLEPKRTVETLRENSVWVRDRATGKVTT